MQAIFLCTRGAPERAFAMRDLPSPPLAAHDIRIHVEASGLNFADVLARLGLYPEAPPLPCILGYEVVGRVVERGASSSLFQVGERVVAFTRFGGYASEVVVPERNAVAIAEQMDAAVAAALGTQGTTAWFCAHAMVNLQAGDHVLIQAAAGGVGTILVQLARRCGCVVYGTTGSEEKIDYLLKQGVDYPIHSRTQDFYHFIKTQRGQAGLDVVFDSLGGRALRQGFKLLAPGGRMVSYGVATMAGETRSVLRSLTTLLASGVYHPLQLLTRSRSIIGVNMLQIADARPEWLRSSMQQIVKLAQTGEIRPHAGAVFPATQIAEAHAFLGSRRSQGKVILRWE